MLNITDRKLIYDNRAWDYKIANNTNGTYKISLKNGKALKYIYLKKTEDGLSIWEDKMPKQLLTNKPADQKFAIVNDQPFKAPLIKNDSTTLTGFINGYSPKLGFKTGMIYVDDIISSQQNSYAVYIAADGSFTVKFPMVYPEGCFLAIADSYQTIFLAPGKKTFVYIDFLKGEDKYLYMGDYATVNRELKETSPMIDFDYNRSTAKAVELGAMPYQNYIIDQQNKSLAKIKNYRAEHGMSLKGYQLVTNNIKYRAAVFLLEYNRFRQGAYAKASEGKNAKDIAEYKPVKLDDAYLSIFAGYPLMTSCRHCLRTMIPLLIA
ncbi:hypothetical protein [Mucilaginibacter antarcticus]|uniref:hypothetical protein n=1 Tax=Mucilaginibacter antarcticus TaxID=1855725 RepID=UPI003641A0C9